MWYILIWYGPYKRNKLYGEKACNNVTKNILETKIYVSIDFCYFSEKIATFSSKLRFLKPWNEREIWVMFSYPYTNNISNKSEEVHKYFFYRLISAWSKHVGYRPGCECVCTITAATVVTSHSSWSI